MATIRDRLGDMTATQRLGSIKYLLMRANLPPVCWLWLNRSSTASQRAASAAQVPIELTYNPVSRGLRLSAPSAPYNRPRPNLSSMSNLGQPEQNPDPPT